MSKENNNNALLPSEEFKALCGYHFINFCIKLRCMVEKNFTLRGNWLWNYSLFWFQNNSQISPTSLHLHCAHVVQAAIILSELLVLTNFPMLIPSCYNQFLTEHPLKSDDITFTLKPFQWVFFTLCSYSL